MQGSAVAVIEDKRRTNRLEDHLKEAHAMLEAWGQMYLSDSPRPWARTPLERGIYGPHGAPTGSQPATYISPDLETVDKAVAWMTPVRRLIVEIVYVRYRDWPMEEQRKIAGVSEGIFTKEKNIARESVRTALLMSREPRKFDS
jgi:hypothetical protein